MRSAAVVLLFAAVAAAQSPGDLAKKVSQKRLEAVVRSLAGFGTRHTASDPKGAPAMRPHVPKGIGAARKWIYGEFAQIHAKTGRLEISEQKFPAAGNRRIDQGVEIVNVFATLRGWKTPDRIYVVSGHYDSRALDARDAKSNAPGANDDASGTAVVIEMAHIFAEHPPEATIVFLCVAGEEQGLLGSRHFAKKARAAEKWDIAGMITNDIVGNTLGPDGKRYTEYVRVFSEGMPAAETGPMAGRLRRSLGTEWDSPSRQLARYIHEQAARYLKDFSVKLVFRPDRFLRGGDHMAFNEVGYPAVRFTEPHENYKRQHQNVTETTGDLPEHLDYKYLARVAQVNVVALASLANAPAAPKGAKIHIKQLENSTTLSWKASPAHDLSHYEVVWRDTTAAVWEHAQRVENTEVKLALSKDDWHFGVRAVDKDGHKSPVTYPSPMR